jgi:hypothetical protein
LIIGLFIGVLWPMLVWIMRQLPPGLVPKENADQMTVLQVISHASTWPAFAIATFAIIVPQSFEPIAAPILTSAPYNLNLLQTSGIISIFPFGLVVGYILNAALYLYIGLTAQQLLGLIFIAISLLFLGPSSIMFFVPASLGLWVTAVVTGALGGGTLLGVQPVVLLQVMWTTAKKSKKDLSGALVGTNILTMQFAGFIAAPISSYVYAAVGVPTISTYLLVAVFVICLPCILYVDRWVDGPVIGPFAQPQLPTPDDTEKDKTP